jgi:phosphoribosyl 1,2-cyclic phosphodiesterase
VTRAGPAPLALRFWGVRGSVPTPGPATVRHGGNTSCVEITAGARRLVLDAGTGLRALGERLRGADAAAPVDVLVTHAHADHVQGLPFFAPLFEDGEAVTLHTPAGLGGPIADAVRALMRPPLVPAPIADADPRRVRFAALPPAGDETVVAGFRVRSVAAAHPGGAAGFRVADDAGAAIVYLPDNELAAAESAGGGRRALLAAVAGARVLVHDATYLPGELPRHHGWGHSSYAEAVRLAADAGVRRLVLFHHHPDRTDDEVDRLAADAAALGAACAAAVEVTVAREGETLLA